MFAHVIVHVDQFGGFLRQPEGCLLDRFRRAEKCQDGTVVIAVGLSVEQDTAGHALCGLDQGFVAGLILLTAEAEIGDAFDKSCHFAFSSLKSILSIGDFPFSFKSHMLNCVMR